MTAEERFECHVNNSRKTKSKCPAIENAIKYYGAENFEVITVRWCDTKEDACYWEEVYTKFFKTTNKKYGYNLKEGGLELFSCLLIYVNKTYQNKLTLETM